MPYTKATKAMMRLNAMETQKMIDTLQMPGEFHKFIQTQDIKPNPYIYGTGKDGSNVKYSIKLHLRCSDKKGLDCSPSYVLPSFLKATHWFLDNNKHTLGITTLRNGAKVEGEDGEFPSGSDLDKYVDNPTYNKEGTLLSFTFRVVTSY